MIKKLSFSKFIKKYRPYGVGITIIYTPEKTEIIEFREVICDFCNAEIIPKKLCSKCQGTGTIKIVPCSKCKGSGYCEVENNVYLIYDNGICESCSKTYTKKTIV